MSFEKAPRHYTLAEIRDPEVPCCSIEVDVPGARIPQWVPCRPLGYPSWRQRFKLAWMVFTGKADVVTWPGGQ